MTAPRRPATVTPGPRAEAATRRHLRQLQGALASLDGAIGQLEAWGCELAARLPAGARLLVAGNGGSAAEAQHLTAELVGRYRCDRPPMSALALHAETSSVTAIANDYGAAQVFARQVEAHGRPGDVLLVLSTSGRSANVLAAAAAARRGGLVSWALTGPSPNPLASAVDAAVAVDGADAAAVQEAHLVAVHLVCEVLDCELEDRRAAPRPAPTLATRGVAG